MKQPRHLLGRHGLGQPSYREHGNVVFLTEFLGGVGNIEGGLVAQVVDAVEAEEFAGGFAGFYYAVGEKKDAVAGVEVEADLVVVAVGQHAEWQGPRQDHPLAGGGGGEVAGVGGGKVAT